MHYCEELYQIIIVIITVWNVFIHLEQKSKWMQSLADNLNERFHNNKCRKCESCLEYTKFQDKLLIFTCFKEDLVNFVNTYEICDWGINKLCFMLWKGVIFMNTWVVGKDLTKQNYQQKKNFTIPDTWIILQILFTKMQNKSLERFWIKISWGFSQFVCSKWYIFIGWCIWKVLEQMFWNIRTWSWSFFISTRFVQVWVCLKKTK